MFEQIAELAIEYKTGARSLRGIFEELLTPILYVVPDDPTIREVQVASLFTEPVFVRRRWRCGKGVAFVGGPSGPNPFAAAAALQAAAQRVRTVRRIPRRLRRW